MCNSLCSETNESFRDVVRVLEDIARRDPDRLDAAGGDPGVTPGIKGRAVSPTMAFAIDFDGEQGFGTIEIEAVFASGMLVPETDAFGVAAQKVPKQNFRQGHLPTQPTRASHRLRAASDHVGSVA